MKVWLVYCEIPCEGVDVGSITVCTDKPTADFLAEERRNAYGNRPSIAERTVVGLVGTHAEPREIDPAELAAISDPPARHLPLPGSPGDWPKHGDQFRMGGKPVVIDETLPDGWIPGGTMTPEDLVDFRPISVLTIPVGADTLQVRTVAGEKTYTRNGEPISEAAWRAAAGRAPSADL